MGESDGTWGEVAEAGDEWADLWDGFQRLPEPGDNDALDAFVASKHISIDALARLGTRLSDPLTLAFGYSGGVKYRQMETGQRWNALESSFAKLKIIRAGGEPRDTVIVAEGETDGARLTMLYDADVAVLPAGAKRFTAGFAEQLRAYRQVLVGLDNDAAGEEGWAKIAEHLPHAQRFAPPGNDWCELGPDASVPPLPAPEDAPDSQLIVFGDLADFELPEQASWFEGDLLPIGGQLVIHGWAKSFKSFLALDMMAALAQGHDWAGFEPIEEPVRVCTVQWEIPPKYYRDRLRLLHRRAHDPALFQANFGTWTPLKRPVFTAGNQAQEDSIRRGLVNAGVQVVLFDPVRRALGGLDPNSEKDVRTLLGFFQSLQDEGITVVFAHHDNKASARAGGSDSTSMTGSGAWAGDADTIVHVDLPKGDKLDESKRRNLHFLLRNAESPGPRGFEITHDSKLLYSPAPHGPLPEEDEPAL